MRVLVTGGYGFIGSNLVISLSNLNCNIDIVQLHGDETPEQLCQVAWTGFSQMLAKLANCVFLSFISESTARHSREIKILEWKFNTKKE